MTKTFLEKIEHIRAAAVECVHFAIELTAVILLLESV
jgi:hypothetical protein